MPSGAGKPTGPDTEDQLEDSRAFRYFIERTIAAISEVAEGVRRNVSDLNLLRYAAITALEDYPRGRLVRLFLTVIERAPREVRIELATLLVSFYEINDEAEQAYRKERDTRTKGPWYRFELPIDPSPPEWMSAISPRDYARAIVAEVVARHLIEAGGWERPVRLAPSRRGIRRPVAPPSEAL